MYDLAKAPSLPFSPFLFKIKSSCLKSSAPEGICNRERVRRGFKAEDDFVETSLNRRGTSRCVKLCCKAEIISIIYGTLHCVASM